MYYGTMVERHIVVQEFTESRELFLVWQFARQQQECHLLESEAFLFQQRSHQLVELVAAIVQFSLCRHRFTVLVGLISHHITYIGESHEHARAVLITKSSLHAILRKQFVVNLTRVLYLIAEFVYQIFLLHRFLLFLLF